jgi:hypothetical protein
VISASWNFLEASAACADGWRREKKRRFFINEEEKLALQVCCRTSVSQAMSAPSLAFIMQEDISCIDHVDKKHN